MMQIVTTKESVDKSIKYIFSNEEGIKVESIYFTYIGQRKHKPIEINTLCISSQAGCQMDCSFCATGKGGFFANLTAEDMLQQITSINKDLASRNKPEATSYAIMGMGEPLMNFEEICKFYKDVKKTKPYIDPISISTVGITPKIKELADNKEVNFKLFVSIHSPFDEERNKLIPINKKYHLKKLIETCEYYAKQKNERVEMSYMLIKGFNDTKKHAEEFAKLLNPDYFDVQILLFNSIKNSTYQRPSEEDAIQFNEIIKKYGIVSNVQISKGVDVDGGCGQFIQDNKKKSAKKEKPL
ncbi:radical SAM protein [Candidatus Woesearchaeota archaeon]|nr:radical SAM protein [Candidatus Woesearchaeota archaeon]